MIKIRTASIKLNKCKQFIVTTLRIYIVIRRSSEYKKNILYLLAFEHGSSDRFYSADKI